jgi:hypothetical protein
LNTASLYGFIAVSFWLCIWGLAKPGRIYQYPFLAGVVFAGYLLPEALGLINDMTLPEGGYATAMMVAILCGIALYLGSTWHVKPFTALQWKFDPARLLVGALFLSLFGAAFTILLGTLPEEMLMEAQWSGTTVAYQYLAQTQLFGLALAATTFASRPSKLALGILIFDLAFYSGTVFVAGRRAITVKIGVILLSALWFKYRWAPPRLAVIGVVLAAVLLVFSIGQYRALTGTAAYGGWGGHLPTLEEFASIDFVGNFARTPKEGTGAHELRNAIYDLAAVQATGDYNFGKWYWNGFVFTALPAQILGRELKDALMFDLRNLSFDTYQFQALIGGTHTFISDTFQAFWYFGAIVFFVIGRILGSLYHAAMNGHVVAQVAYMTSIGDGLLAITHESVWYFTPWVFFFIFMVPVFLYARIRAPLYGPVFHASQLSG